MTLNPQLVTELMRQRFGWPDDSNAARVLNLIPQALKETARTIAADQFLRELLVTDRGNTYVSIGTGGQLDLVTGYDTYQFLLEYFDKGQIYFLPSATVAGEAATGTLTIASATGTAATGYLIVSVPNGVSEGTLTIRQGEQATGSYTVVNLPNAADTIVVNGVTFTFVASSPSSVQIPIQTSRPAQAVSIAQVLTAYATANPTSNVAAATYFALGSFVFITHTAYGTAGNSFTTVGNVRVTAAAATLAGGVNGVQSGESVYVNGVQCTFTTGSDPNVAYAGEPEDDAANNVVNLANAIVNSGIANLALATYETKENVLEITATQAGAAGSSFALVGSAQITASGSTLTGGTGGITEGETIVINGVTFTFSNYNVGSTYIPFSSNGTAVESADLLAEFLNASASGSINVATYTPSLPPPAQQTDDDVMRAVLITYDSTGVGGNAYTLANSSGSGVVRSAATLEGGIAGTVVNNETVVINGVTVTFKTSAGAFPEVQIGGTPTITATNLAAGLNGSVDPLLFVATYTASGPVVTITYDSYGTSGNAFTLAYSSLFGVIPSGPTLSGGSGGVNVTNNTFTIESFVDNFSELDRVQFLSTNNYPAPILEETNYYIVNYVQAANGLSATFQVATNADGTGLVVVTDRGSGILSVHKFEGSGYPMQQLASPQLARLPQYLSSEFHYFWVEGNTLYLQQIDGSYPTGQVGFAVPYYPTTVEMLPESAEAEKLFLQVLADLLAAPLEANA